MSDTRRPLAPSLFRFACVLSLVGSARAASVSASDAKIPRAVPASPDAKSLAPSVEGGVPRGSLTAKRAEIATARTTAVADPAAKPVASGVASRVPRERAPGVHVAEEALDGGGFAIWARGRAYKARFGVDGATCVPFFGSSADRNHPVRFVLARAAVGGTELELDARALPVREGAGVAYARGSLVERWSWSDEALEQTFAFESLPSSGELVLAVAVDTDLEPRAGDRGAIRFEHELGRVEYGAAVAIDADGRRFALTSVWNEGAIEMRLDAAAVASARFPLLVDPVVSTFAVDVSGTDDFAPDTAYEAATDSWLVVEESAYSATDHDVYATRLDAAGNVLYANWLDVTTDDWRRPRVASNAIAQNFLCVASVTPVGGGQRRIRGVTFSAPNNAIGAQFTISGSESGDKLNPDVGGDPVLAGPTYYMVVWERAFSSTDHDVHARRVEANGALSATIFVDNSSNTIDTYPAISKSDGHAPYATQAWTIVWQRFGGFGTQEQVFGAQYAWDAALVHATFPIDTGDECLRPTVSSLLDYDSGFGRAYMVAFQVRGFPTNDWDVVGAVFEGTQFLVGTDVGNQVSIATNPDDQIEPCVDSDGQHFSVAYAQLFNGSFGDWDVFVADLVYSAGYPYLCAWDTFAYSTLQERAPRIVATYSGGGARRRYVGAWDELDQYTSGATHDVQGGLWDGCEGGFAEPYCFGDGSGAACPCGNFGAPGNGCASSIAPNGANLASAGNPWIANDSFVLLGSGMPNSAALYFVGTAPSGAWSGTPFGDGLRCVAGNVVRIGTKQNSGGASQYPEPGDQSLSSVFILPSTGAVLFYQVWYRNAAAYCTTATYNLTNGLDVVWGPAQ